MSGWRQWMPIVAFAWMVPGGGHLLLGRRLRGLALGGAVALSFVLGLLLRGPFFEWTWTQQDMLASLIYRGGFVVNLAAGLPYFLAVWLGYAEPDLPGHAHDYGAKFLVVAGLLNLLCMVDAFEIATGRKE